jgi:hypothetical protein
MLLYNRTMRGRELLQLINSLTPREAAYVRAGFATQKFGVEYALLFDAMASQKTFNKKTLSNSIDLSERRISTLLPVFGRQVVKMLGAFHQEDEEEFETSLNAAWKMVMRLKNGPATAIIQDIYTRAIKVERFDVILELHEMAEVMTEPLVIPGESRHGIAALQENLQGYEALKSAFLKLKTANVVEKKHIVEQAGNSALLKSESAARSIRARTLYYWIKARLSFYQKDILSTVNFQEKTIGMLTEFAWLKRERDFFLIKEHEPLIAFMFAANMDQDANAMIFKVGNMSPKQEREELIKWQQMFPMRLTVAINAGNQELAQAALEDFKGVRTQYGDLFPTRFINKNLYWIAFYQLANQEYEAARKTSIQLLKEGKSTHFEPLYLPMTRILSAVLSYEMGEHEDLLWQEKTFRMTKAYQATEFYKLVLSLLCKLSAAKSILHQQTILNEYAERAREMESDPIVRSYFNFFDIGNWIESKQSQCSMLQVFEARALSLRASSESLSKKSLPR